MDGFNWNDGRDRGVWRSNTGRTYIYSQIMNEPDGLVLFLIDPRTTDEEHAAGVYLPLYFAKRSLRRGELSFGIYEATLDGPPRFLSYCPELEWCAKRVDEDLMERGLIPTTAATV